MQLFPRPKSRTRQELFVYRFVSVYENSTTNPYSFPITDLATQYRRRQHAADCIPHVFLLVTKSLISLTVMRFSSESCSIKMANWRTLRKLLPISNSSLPQNIRNLKQTLLIRCFLEVIFQNIFISTNTPKFVLGTLITF